MRKGLLAVALANFAAAGAVAVTMANFDPAGAAPASPPTSVKAEAPRPLALPVALTTEQAATLRQKGEERASSVVTVDAYTEKGGEPDHRQAAGVVISASGFIFAPLFAVSGAEIIIISYAPGVRSPARLLARDTRCHLAILKATFVPPGVSFPAFCGASDEKANAGAVMVALDRKGNRTLTGAVAGPREEIGPLRDVLEVRMDGAPSELGGVVFSEQGQLLGLVLAASADNQEEAQAKESRTAIYVLPASQIRAAMERILQGAPGSDAERQPKLSIA